MFYQIILKILIYLHNYLYYIISKIASKLNNNIHPKHRIMNYHQFFLSEIEKDSKVLDIGCGYGSLTFDIAEKAQSVFAIDINENLIKKAIRRFNRDNIKYIINDATKYNFNETFYYIILSNVLEHIKNRLLFLNKIKYLATIFLVRVPMINRSWLTLYKKDLGLEYRLDHTHYIEYTYDTFKSEIESAGLSIIDYSIQFGEIWAKIKLLDK